jgi:hypothetical protein
MCLAAHPIGRLIRTSCPVLLSGCGKRRHIHTEDLREIDEAAARIEIQGASYPEALEARTGL